MTYLFIEDPKYGNYKYEYFIKPLLDKYGWKLSKSNMAVYSNRNKKSLIKTFIMGMTMVLPKHNLAKYFHKFDFVPLSYVIENGNLKNIPDNLEKNIYYLKQSNIGLGSALGITLLELENNVHKILKSHINNKNNYVLQQNIPPLLHEKRKFDIRIYVIILSDTFKYHTYVFKKGLLRKTINEYKSHNISDTDVFLTNTSVQKKINSKIKYTDYSELFDDNHIYYKYFNNFVDIIKQIVKYMASKTSCFNYGYNVFGLDFILSSDKKVYLLEFNHQATINTSDEYHVILSNEIFAEFYDMVFKPYLTGEILTKPKYAIYF